MLTEIQSTYETQGRQADLAKLLVQLVATPADGDVNSPDYHQREQDLHEDFQRFVGSRNAAAMRDYSSKFGTKRWEIVAFEPVRLMESVHTGNLNVIPFTEYEEFAHHASFTHSGPYGWSVHYKTPTPKEAVAASRAIGFYVTPYSPRKVLNHVTMVSPWIRNYSTHIGVVRRYTPIAIYRPPAESRAQIGNQRKFGQFLRELIDFEK